MTLGASSLTGVTRTATRLWSVCTPSDTCTVKLSSMFSESSWTYIRVMPGQWENKSMCFIVHIQEGSVTSDIVMSKRRELDAFILNVVYVC